eukprot:TRINITY_DN262_c0_g1_i6.p1 TRINITY_DN262_c0_g1~~TRINITY_DN262_c0_g1_i6.p1  ORF type:complete len:1359 (+),score=565.70 TRINITY_DN262_c0_g1_i6:95-4078(+)
MPGQYLLGCDVGGTFTDLVLIEAATSKIAGRCKTPSTPEDQSIGIENGIAQICKSAGIDKSQIEVLLHGTTVATNAILEGKGSKVGLITTEGYRQVLHIDRSFVPGGLGGWIVWRQPELLATLDNTVECRERVDGFGKEVRPVDEGHLRQQLRRLKDNKVDAVTVSLLNAYAGGAGSAHEKQVRQIVEQELPGVPVSMSHEVLPEMYEYERALTTVANAYIRPKVQQYIGNLKEKAGGTRFKVLRSDGGLSGEHAARDFPVNLLMSGPAGGVAGAAWVCGQAGYKNLLTLDMGGTSTDVAMVRDGKINTRRETKVGDLTVRAQALDVHTIGAGGGSIAKVPDLTKALRVGPESAGARPGPACYGRGGEAPAVSDANCVLGNLPRRGLLGGDFKLDVDAARKAVGTVAESLGLSVEQAAEGIIDIVNENMFGALRVVSVEQGFDPRDFCLVPFGGAGALHACAIAQLMGSWPVVVPPSPGLLCALGDATTTIKNSKSSSFVRDLVHSNALDIAKAFEELAEQARQPLDADGVPRGDQSVEYEVDMRFKGQGLTSVQTINVPDLARLRAADGTEWLKKRLEEEHTRAFTFTFDCDHEVVNLRVNVDGKAHDVRAKPLEVGGQTPPAESVLGKQDHYHGGKSHQATIYERAKLLAANRVEGPAIIVEMDSTTLVPAGCVAKIDRLGMIVINPAAEVPSRMLNGEPDKITLEVIENALRSARFEMDAVVYRTAMSPGIREQHDQFPIIAAPSGDMVVGQFGSFIPGLLRRYTKPIHDGDVLLMCDPYTCDGAVSHLNDWLVVTPVYFEGTHVGWSSMFGHMTDVGGMVACSMPNQATEIFQEGLSIPPVKLYRKGVLNEDLLELVLHQVRKPDWNRCDLKALVASIQLAKSRVQELCKRFGPKTFLKTLDLMLLRNKNAMHEIIKTQVQEEKLYFEDYVCDDGQGHGPFKVACTLQKVVKDNGEHHAIFDFTGTDPQAPSSVNFFLNTEMFKMFCGAYMVMVFDPQILFNDGFYPLLEVRVPDGTLLKPRRPAALSCRTHMLGRVFDILGGLLGQRAPQFMCAAGFSDSPHFMYWGDDNGQGERFQYYGIVFGGIPGRPFGDGPDGHSLWPNFTNVPCEFMERYFPIRIEVCESIADSGGAGSFRGGNGMRIAYRFLADGRINIHDDKWWTSPWGVNGGRTGSRSTKIIYRQCGDALTSEREERVPSKIDAFPVRKGDVLHYVTWGGGGWGKPWERQADLVQRDVVRGLVTAEGAKKNYGVVLGAAPQFAVDEGATKAARAALAAEAAGGELFDFGWKKDIKATKEDVARLRARCQEETGFPAPAALPGCL